MAQRHRILCASAAFVSTVIVVVVVKRMTTFYGNQVPEPTFDKVNNKGKKPSDCGIICTYNSDEVKPGKLYPLLIKKVDCPSMMDRMLHPPYQVIKPPPRTPPQELVMNFSQNGQCQLTQYSRYFDETTLKGRSEFSYDEFTKLMARGNVSNINVYGDGNVLKQSLMKYVDVIRNMHVAVVGTETPWAEAMLLNLGAQRITTVEYREIIIHHPKIQTITPYKLAGEILNGNNIQYDSVFSYSSVEHSGLGRYGDPIAPFGDLEATAHVWCLTKPGGHFFLTVPVTGNGKGCHIAWNAHRIYGDTRLQHLTANWRVLESFDMRDSGHQMMFVLQKPASSR